MAVTFDAQNSLQGTDVTGFTFALTVASQANLCLFVVVGYRKDAGQSVSTVTYNGDSLAQVTGATIGNPNAYSEIWYMVAPDTGTNNVIVTMSASVRGVAGAASFYGVNQVTPWSAVTTNTGSDSDSGTVTVTSVATSQVLSLETLYVGFNENFRLSVVGAETEDFARNGTTTTTFHVEVGMSHIAGSASTVMAWTYDRGTTVTRPWSIIGLSIDEAPTTVIPVFMYQYRQRWN